MGPEAGRGDRDKSTVTRTERYIAWFGAILALLVTSLVIYRAWGGRFEERVESIPRIAATPPAKIMAMSVTYAPFSEIDYSTWSKYIVIGTVRGVLPAIWDDDKEYIYTPVVVRVEKRIKGPSPVKELTIHLIGGSVGDSVLYVSDTRIPEPGERYFLFVGDMHRSKTDKLVPVAQHFGMVRIEGELAFPQRPPNKPEPLDPFIANIEAAMRGEFFPTPTPTWAPPPTQIPSGGLYPPKPPRPVKPGE